MKTVKKFLFSLSLFIISSNGVSMENPGQVNPQVDAATTRAIFSHKENIFKDLQNDTEQAKFVFFDTFVFTNQQLANTMKKAHDNGAHIEGTLGTHWCNKNIENFFDTNDMNVNTVSQNHLKRFLLSEKNPHFGSPGKHTVYVGSANPTNYAYNNHETMTKTENDKEFFMEHFKDHMNLVHNVETCTSAEKKVLECTPTKKNTAFGSRENALIASKIERVRTLIKSKNEQRILYISSMTWNSAEMTQALIDAQQSGVTIHVIVDRCALEGKGKEQLMQMHKAHVPIHVYDSGENNRTIQHSKVMVRIDGPDYLVINSTANMTPEGDKENNSDSYHNKNTEQLGKDMQESLDNLIADNRCKAYTSELAAMTENKKTEKKSTVKKRMLFDTSNLDVHTFPDANNTDNDSNKKMKK